MSTNSVVSIHPYFKVQPGQLEAARALLRQFVDRTSKEPGCRFYDFTINGDVIFCREGYVDAAAALAHLENVGELIQQMLEVSELFRLELHGPAAELDLMRGPLGVFQPAWFVLECGLQR